MQVLEKSLVRQLLELAGKAQDLVKEVMVLYDQEQKKLQDGLKPPE